MDAQLQHALQCRESVIDAVDYYSKEIVYSVKSFQVQQREHHCEVQSREFLITQFQSCDYSILNTHMQQGCNTAEKGGVWVRAR